MNCPSGEILEAALIEPVTLTKRGKDKLVILTAEQYQKLVGQSYTQAYSLLGTPDDIHKELMIGLDDIIGADDA